MQVMIRILLLIVLKNVLPENLSDEEKTELSRNEPTGESAVLRLADHYVVK